MAQRGNHKLSYRFFGPFTIVAKVGVVAYKLNLPEDSKIHLVVHVSQLKKHVPAEVVVDERVDQLPSDLMEIVCLVKLIDARMIKRGSSTLHQIQVQWSGMPPYLSTWEEVDDLRRRYPECPAWGQAGFQGGATIMKLTGTIGDPTTGKDRVMTKRCWAGLGEALVGLLVMSVGTKAM